MKRLCALLVLFFIITGCTSVSESPQNTPDVSADSSIQPAAPTPPAISDGVTPEPSPYEEHPSVDLSAQWADNGLEIDGLSYQNTFKAGGVELLQASGHFPQTGNSDIDAYYQRCKDDFVRLCEAQAKDAAQFEINRAYVLNADFAIECNAGGLLSVYRKVYQDMGGAHGQNAVICEVFSVSDGKLLALEDFFTVDRDTVTARLTAEMEHIIDTEPDLYYSDAKDVLKTFFPYDTFCVTNDGLRFYFAEYSIAPYASGIIIFDIPWGAVHDIFKLPV